ncbi:phage tail protein [Clostridium chromiireducens]|uniref:Phage tail protein n=1 Tax=Clostridium chromiireducens TaxID=225345 RepID=A0A964RIS7_9CLOT|nr:distal tail protein Dit [Clostridium chromiireducens]MVX62235.1 phage tail protein [Clostridium chromiireducens]
MLSIIYNNKDSNKDYNLYLEEVPNFPVANAQYETIDIPGRDGSVNIFDKYPDLVIPIKFVFISGRDFLTRKNSITQWLNSKANFPLYYSEDKSMFYNVKKIALSDFTTEGNKIRRVAANFTIESYMYLNEGNEIREINSPTKIYNGRATHISLPYLKIYGSGDINLNINNRVTQFKNISDFIEIDSKKPNCYKTINDIITNSNDSMFSSIFPYLDPGENEISWSGNLSKIEIIPRWCCR